MSKNNTPIVKAEGVNDSEKLLAMLCDKVFLKLWAYANPQKQKGDELCDVLAVFENHVFIFSDKNISFKSERTTTTDLEKWESWKNEAIDKSIYQIRRAEKWILKNPEKIFLDSQCTVPLPLTIDKENLKIHRIIVAHGAEEACKNDSQNNIDGSLAICYNDLEDPKELVESPGPFHLVLPRDEVIHVFDSHNLEIILGELDTVRDLLLYFEEKEKAIKKYDTIVYFGEEELLAHYFSNFDEEDKKYSIDIKDEQAKGINLKKGFWQGFTNHPQYQKRKQANEISYTWDRLLQKTFEHALEGTLKGRENTLKGHAASVEMAKEPRVSRRMLSESLLISIEDFFTREDKEMHYLAYFSSYYHDLMYVFFQMPLLENIDYEKEYRPRKREMLNIACGAVKNKYPDLKKIIGITVDLPRLNGHYSEDFILLEFKEWSKETADFFKKANKDSGLNAFESDNQKLREDTIHDFPLE